MLKAAIIRVLRALRLLRQESSTTIRVVTKEKLNQIIERAKKERKK